MPLKPLVVNCAISLFAIDTLLLSIFIRLLFAIPTPPCNLLLLIGVPFHIP